jgi:hypothetical protein
MPAAATLSHSRGKSWPLPWDNPTDINNDEIKSRSVLPGEWSVFTLGNGHAYRVDNLQPSTAQVCVDAQDTQNTRDAANDKKTE